MSDLVEKLAAAFDGGAAVDASSSPVTTLEEGYRLQDALVQRLGRPIVGWKLAQTREASQKPLGLTEATVAPLIEGMIVPDGTVFAAERFRRPEVEAEIAIELSAPLSGRPSITEIAEAVSGVRLAIEVADTRYVDKPAAGVPGVVADLNSCGALVVGPLEPLAALDTLQNASVTARLGDGTIVNHLPPEARPDPLSVVAFLLEFLGRSGRSLEAGAIITTGTHTPPTVSGPGEIKAEFIESGLVSATLSAPRAT